MPMPETFATVLNCMDGRVQVPVTLYLLDRFGVDHIDTITEAGIVRYLSDETDTPHTESTLHSTLVSLEKHGSRQIAVVAHDDCSGNPIPAEMQQQQIHAAVSPLVKAVRGRGCLVGIELDGPAQPVRAALREAGVLAGGSGDPDVLRLMPPLTASDDDVTVFVAAFAQAIHQSQMPQLT